LRGRAAGSWLKASPGEEHETLWWGVSIIGAHYAYARIQHNETNQKLLKGEQLNSENELNLIKDHYLQVVI
jgi:hypothetical protein